MKLKKFLGSVALIAAATLALVACAPSKGNSQGGTATTGKETTVKVGVMTLNDVNRAVWTKVAEKAAEKGVKVNLVEFTDYTQPNKAITDGDVDINSFQHIYYLNNWNKEANTDIQVAGYTVYTPIRLYSGLDGDKEKYDSLEAIPDGATVGIPDDATNKSRALYLLEQAGLIKLDVKDNGLATQQNIVENDKKLDIKEVEADQLVRTRGSLDAAVINTNYAQQGGVDLKTAIFVEQPSDLTEQWYNVIAAANGWEKSDKADAIKVIVQAYNSKDIADIYQEKTDGAELPIWDEKK